MSPITSTDRIEKEILLNSPRSRVWRALTDAREFGSWFGVALDDQFAPGETVRGTITSAGYERVTLELIVESMEPERYFSFRWRPYAIDPDVDYSHEPRTLVAFTLEAAGEGTLLRVVESGFDGIPAHRRAKAFEMDSKGWAQQMVNIRNHLASAAAG